MSLSSLLFTDYIGYGLTDHRAIVVNGLGLGVRYSPLVRSIIKCNLLLTFHNKSEQQRLDSFEPKY